MKALLYFTYHHSGNKEFSLADARYETSATAPIKFQHKADNTAAMMTMSKEAAT